MNLFGWFKADRTREAVPDYPWDRHPSIYEHLLAHIEPGSLGLKDGGESLPDEKPPGNVDEIRWAPGALDGVLSHHTAPPDDNHKVTQLHGLIRNYCQSPTVGNQVDVYNSVVAQDAIGFIDELIERVIKDDALNQRRLYELCSSLVTQSPDRGAVKVGIALLGLFRNPENLEVIRVLGRHEEFTLYAAVALANGSDDPETELWNLARHVAGWGRIHLVERLGNTQRSDIKEWMLREGYKNSVMNEYLAYTCAVAGGLREALDRDSVDEALLSSAGEIIEALLNDGPTSDIRDYEHGAVVIESYLRHLLRSEGTIPQFLAAAAIAKFVREPNRKLKSMVSSGWDEDPRRRIDDLAAEVISRPGWRQKVAAALSSDDEAVFFNAQRAAEHLGIDAWPRHWQRLQEKPLDSGRWFYAMKSVSAEHIADALSLARRVLDLNAIGSGPANALGIGPDFEQHRCHEFLVFHLGRFPGQGFEFVLAGLQSPVVRIRNMALRALAQWGIPQWPCGAREAVQAAASREPDAQVKRRMLDLLEGKPLDLYCAE